MSKHSLLHSTDEESGSPVSTGSNDVAGGLGGLSRVGDSGGVGNKSKASYVVKGASERSTASYVGMEDPDGPERESTGAGHRPTAGRFYDRPTGMRLIWNRCVESMFVLCFGAVIYVIYMHSFYMNLLVTREYVEAQGSLTNWTRSDIDHMYPKLYTVWINLKSDHLTSTQVRLLEKGDFVNLDPNLGCHSLQGSHGPMASVSLRLISTSNSSNHSHSSNSSNSSYASSSSVYYDARRGGYFEEYAQYSQFYGNDYERVLARYYAVVSNGTNSNDANDTNGTYYGNMTTPAPVTQHNISYAEDIIYRQDEYFGFLVCGLCINCLFLCLSYGAILYRLRARVLEAWKVCEVVQTHQIVIKHIYFPKCAMSRCGEGLLLCAIGVTTPLYFVGSILPVLAYNYNLNDVDASDGLCLVVNEGLAWSEDWLETVFEFMFWWCIGCTGMFMLSYCLPEDYKRESCQKNTIYVALIFMLVALAIGVRIAITMHEEILYSYAGLAGAYLLTFLLSLTMF